MKINDFIKALTEKGSDLGILEENIVSIGTGSENHKGYYVITAENMSWSEADATGQKREETKIRIYESGERK